MIDTIELNKGFVTLIDKDYYDYFNQFTWHINSSGYAARTDVNQHPRRNCTLHRELYKLHNNLTSDDIKNLQIDHINRNKLDNRLANLRLCTAALNCANQGKSKLNTTGYKGVTFFHSLTRDSYIARLTFQGKNLCLGNYSTAEEAAIAYNLKAKELWGEFAYQNDVDNSKPIFRLSRPSKIVTNRWKGYYYDKKHNKWRVMIKDLEGNKVTIGHYNSEEEAKEKYKNYLETL